MRYRKKTLCALLSLCILSTMLLTWSFAVVVEEPGITAENALPEEAETTKAAEIKNLMISKGEAVVSYQHNADNAVAAVAIYENNTGKCSYTGALKLRKIPLLSQ